MARHFSNSNGFRIACTALMTLLVGGSLASPAKANWQPRASITPQNPETRVVADWQPRRAFSGVKSVAAARDTGPTRKPRSTAGSLQPGAVLVEGGSTEWKPRSALTVAASAVKPTSADWKPRSSVKSDAVLVGELSRKRLGRRPHSKSVAPEKLATSSLAF
jgi:hypothetical protein